jgi:hypothetical protein
MKTLVLTTLATGLMALNVASATAPGSNEIFEAIDGESYGLHLKSTPRFNYSISASDMASSPDANEIFNAIDGESYGLHTVSSTRVNYSVSPGDMNRGIQGLPKTYD